MSSEFQLIQRWFDWSPSSVVVDTAVGDDAAILNQMPQSKPAEQLLVSMDTFIVGVHCPEETSPHAIGYKALAVNLSDMAAMGAIPSWFTLAVTLPKVDEQWLDSFVAGMKELANSFDVALVGGDTTKGVLSITINIAGYAKQDRVLRRSGAQAGDMIYVTGNVGQGRLGLQAWKDGSDRFPMARKHLDYPIPRVHESGVIKQFATSCIDLSDGLLADLKHIVTASSVGARIQLDQLPLSDEMQSLPPESAYQYALEGGDDYELLFTVPQAKIDVFENAMAEKQYGCYQIGVMDGKEAVSLYDGDTQVSHIFSGYDHFS